MISTKGRYALRVMIDLAQNDNGAYVPLSEIAQRQDISVKYLEIILKTLVKEKLLKGHRGKGGGYMLTRSPEDYTVWEILNLTEGAMATVACLAEGADECPRMDKCPTVDMWREFDKKVYDFFSNITLADFVDKNKG